MALLIRRAPDLYAIGECVCDISVLDKLANDIVLSLPAIAEIGCEIIDQAVNAVLKVGAAAIPGGGEALDAGMRKILITPR